MGRDRRAADGDVLTRDGSRGGSTRALTSRRTLPGVHAVTVADGAPRGRAPRSRARHGELLVDVRAAGLNGADMLQRRGLYAAPPDAPADIPGLELAGEVIATGPAVTSRFSVGDAVMAVVGGGGRPSRARPRAVALPVPGRARLVRGWWLPRGVHDRARRAVHASASSRSGSVSSCTARPVASGSRPCSSPRGRARGSSRRCATRSSARRRGDRRAACGVVDVLRTGRVRRPRPLRRGARAHRCAEHPGRPRRARDGWPHRGHRRRRGCARRARSAPADGARAGGSTDPRSGLGRSKGKAVAARAIERSVLPALASGALRVPIAAELPMDDAEPAYDRFAAGGKLGKIVLVNASR